MSDDRKDLPPVNSPNFLEKVREALGVYMGNRGDKLDRGVTLRDLTDSGIVTLRAGYTSGGGRGLSPIGGVGANVGGEYEADLTPPPTPSGFTASAGLTNIMVGSDSQTYTQGHGHAKSMLYGATWVSGALPVFANAVVLTEFSGTFFAHATNLGTNWHLWLKWVSVDGVASVTPAGGTNGVTASTGKIGNSDLNLLIIEAANLANGTLTTDKFNGAIEPLTIITTAELPTVKSTLMVVFNGKIHRWSGTAYTLDLEAEDLTGTLKPAQLNNSLVMLEDGTYVALANVAANSQVPAINFVGNLPAAPSAENYKRNAVYKNTTDGNSYILAGSPLSWGLYLESGTSWQVKVESENGTIFRVGQASHTMLIAHVFRNGIDVTSQIQASRFRWRRVSYVPPPPPNDDAAWSASYASGYRQIQVSVDEVLAKATFHCDVFDS